MKKVINILLIIYFTSAFISCAIRDAELPVTSRTTFIPPTSPDLVIINLQFSIIEKDVDNYMKCFVDTNYSNRVYSYVPDVTSGIQYPIFRFWNTTNEKSYYTNVLSDIDPTSTSNLFFSGANWISATDTATFDADYLLRLDHQNTSVAKTLKGKIRLILSADSRNLWSIHKWIDIQSLSTDTTWSVLRAKFTN
jgi:hypothetical protein